MGKTKNRFKGIAKVVIGILLILLLITHVNLEELINSFKSVHSVYLFIGFLLFIVASILEAIRLHVLIKSYSHSFMTTFKINIISTFISNFVPSSIGGDGYKIYYLRQRSNNWSKPIAIITIERFSGLLILFLAGVIYVFSNYSKLVDIIYQKEISFELSLSKFLFYIVIIGILILFIGFFFFKKKLKDGISTFKKFYKKFKHVAYGISKFDYLLLIVITVFFQIARLLGLYFLVSCFDAIRLSDLIFVLFFVATISLLPISLGSLGVKEGALVLSLSAFGVSNPAAVAVALLTRIITWFFALVGGIVFIFNKHKSKKVVI